MNERNLYENEVTAAKLLQNSKKIEKLRKNVTKLGENYKITKKDKLGAKTAKHCKLQ